MDRLEPDAVASQYERDFYTWTQEQAAALRRRLAAAGLAEDGLGAADLPAECPWTLDQLLDPDFWPS